MAHSLCKVEQRDSIESERYPGDQHDIAVGLAFAGPNDCPRLPGEDFELLMAE
jgi:hypothetical protein